MKADRFQSRRGSWVTDVALYFERLSILPRKEASELTYSPHSSSLCSGSQWLALQYTVQNRKVRYVDMSSLELSFEEKEREC